jgi:uncharacterized protein with PQ loop repeat
MALSPLLQIRAMHLHRTSQAVSVGYQQVLLVGFVLWLAYGVSLHNLALIVPNTIAGIVSLTTILVARRLRRS